MKVALSRPRRVNAVDVAASALSRVVPRGLSPRIDALRHDLNGVLAGFSGQRPKPYATRSQPPERPLPLREIDPIEHLLPSRGLRRRWVTLRNDLRWLSRDLRGVGRPPVIARKASRYRGPDADSPLSPRPVLVREVVRETDDAVTLRLEERGGAPLSFEAGQFLTFHLDVDGQRLRRAYSLSSSPLDGPTATVTIKRIAGGRASTSMQSVLPGARLFVLGPSGSFTLAEDDRDLALVAGGSGITPVISIAETALRTRPDARVHLLYGNRREADVIFAARLDALAAAYPDRLTVGHALEEPPDGWVGRVGRLDGEAVGAWADALPEGDWRYFLCGPGPMMDAAREALVDRGARTIREERFQSPEQRPAARALANTPMPVQLTVRGEDYTFEVAPGATILEAGIAAGAPLPFSCAMGGCAACKGELISGEVAMDEPNCLTPRERAQGAVLTCCARPLSPTRLEVE